MTPTSLQRQILFVCSGNFYRSRFAEAVFNHEARLTGLGWTAFSRGIRPHLSEGNISHHAESALAERGIASSDTPGPPTKLTTEDLMGASLVIGMHRVEHQAKLDQRFGSWVERAEYWDVPDIPEAQPEHALPRIAAKVGSIIRTLDRHRAPEEEAFDELVAGF